MDPFSEILARVAFVVALVATIGILASAAVMFLSTLRRRGKKPDVQGFHRGEFRMAAKPRDPKAPVVFIHRRRDE